METITDYSRGHVNPESQAVFAEIKSGIKASQLAVLRAYAKHPRGATGQEIADYMRTERHCVSGRLSEMKVLGLLYKTSKRRNKSAVLKITYAGIRTLNA